MKVHKKVLKTFGALLIVGLLFAAMPAGEVKAQTPITVCASGCDHTTIQDAITAANPGETIEVQSGTYVEDLSMLHPVDLIGVGKPVIQGELTINHTGYGGTETTLLEGIRFETLATEKHDNIVLKGVDGITIRGCEFDGAGKFMDGGSKAVQMEGTTSNDVTIEDSTFRNGYYVTIQGYVTVTGLTIKNSTITNVKSGINLQSSADLVVEDTTISVIAKGAENDTYGIRFAQSTGTAENMTVSGGSISVDKNGLVADAGTYHSAIVLRAAASGNLSVKNMAIDGEVVNLSLIPLDASPNWWGSAAGPEAGTVVGDVKVNPWCYNEDCTELYVAEGGLIQDAIDAADPGDTIMVGPGTHQEANIVIEKDNITLQSTDGAENTIIDATGTTRNGILIQNATGVTIDGFTIESWGQVEETGGTRNRRAIVAGENTSNITIKNNIVEYNESQNRQSNGIVSEMNNGPVVIEGNQISGVKYTVGGTEPEEWQGTGIGIWGAKNVTIDGNTIDDVELAIGIYGYDTIETADVTIQNNTVTNSGQAHIHLNHYWGAGIDESNINILGNTFGGVLEYNFEVQNRPSGDAEVDLDDVLANNTFDNAVVIVGGSQIYSSIQDAIDDADPGDTIHVAAGTYEEANIVIEKDNITLQSTDGAENTIIDATGTTRNGILVQNATGVTIDGFTIESWGQVGETGGTRNRRAIVAGENVSSITIKNNIVEYNELQNRQSNGIVSEMNNGPVVIEGNQISGIKYTMGGTEPEEWQGTGIGIWGAKNVTIDGNTIDDVELAIGIYGYDTIETADVTIQNNTVTNSGQAHIHLNHYWGAGIDESNINILGNTFGGVLEYNFEVQNRPSGDAEVDLDGVLANNTFDNAVVIVGGSQIYSSIQAAIDDADPGDTIHVAAGTYVEDLSMPYPLDLIGDGMPVIQGQLDIDHENYNGTETTLIEGIRFEILSDDEHDNIVLESVDGVTIKGCEFDGAGKFMTIEKHTYAVYMPGSSNDIRSENVNIEDCTFDNGYWVTINGYATGLTVKNSTITNVKSGINHQGGGNLVVKDSDFSVIAQSPGSGTYGIRFASRSGTAEKMTVSGGSISVDKDGLIADEGEYHSAIVLRAAASGALSLKNMAIDGEVVNLSSTPLDASPNWWGSAAGPAAGTVVGDVDYTPWCGDEDCTTLFPNEDDEIVLPEDVTGEEIQTAINNAPSGTTIIVPAGTHNIAGGFVINASGLTIYLEEGAIIENNSPCFTINADDTTLTAATLGTATCVPSGGSNGVDVASALTDITIERFEIDGSGKFTGDGISVGGGATNLIIRDMFIHDLNGDGVELADAQSGYTRLRGNLFINNAGLGVNNKRSVAVDAKYNAWGDESGPHGANGDGVSSYVSYYPWTHVDLYLESSGTTNPDVVDSLAQITYTVYANLKNVTGAEFTLKYPTAHLTYVTSEIFGTFDTEALNQGDGTLTFEASNDGSATESGTAVALFSVTFEAGETAGTYLLDLDEETDVFTMASPDGLSTNIYATKLEDKNVVVKEVEEEEEGNKYFLPLILN